jgi:hypothetical protein
VQLFSAVERPSEDAAPDEGETARAEASDPGDTWAVSCQVDLAASAAAARPVFQIRSVSR